MGSTYSNCSISNWIYAGGNSGISDDVYAIIVPTLPSNNEFDAQVIMKECLINGLHNARIERGLTFII